MESLSKPKGKSIILTIVIVAVVIIGAITGFAIWLVTQNSSNQTPPPYTPTPEFTILYCYANTYESFWGNYKTDVYATIRNEGNDKQPNSITVTIRAIYYDNTYNEGTTTFEHSVAPDVTFITDTITIDVNDSKAVGHNVKYEVVVFWEGESWSKTFYP